MKIPKLCLVVVCSIWLCGCATLNPQGKITKTEDGLVFDLNTQGKLTYKDKDVEGEMDTRSPSLLRSIVEGAVVQGMSSQQK